MEEAKTSMIFRIEPHLKKAFEKVAADHDLTASQMLRSFVRNSVEEHGRRNAQSDIFSPSSPLKPSTKVEVSTKKKKSPIESREGLLGMFKRK